MADTSRSGSRSVRLPIAILLLVAMAYLISLAAVDSDRSLASKLKHLAPVLPVVMVASIITYGLRYLRWHLLLASIERPTPFASGFIAYIAGFAFTASPGKAGELIRLRYFRHMGVPHADGVATFIIERCLDLVVLLLLALPIVGRLHVIGNLLAFVIAVLVSVFGLAIAVKPRKWLQHWLRTLGYRRLARWFRILLLGISTTRRFLRPDRLFLALILGLTAWSVQCLGYASAMFMLGLPLPTLVLFAGPPAAMLIGAASMVPGGIGTTEAATFLLLTYFGADPYRAVLAALALRLGSIWFATALGFAAIAWLELQHKRQRQFVHPS